MKHAYMICAWTQAEQLKKLIRALDYSDNDLFIHWDIKSETDAKEFEGVASQCGVYFIPRMSVTWGGGSQVVCILNLLEAAYTHNANYGYYHMMSGVDFPVKSHEYIDQFFNDHAGELFFEERHHETQTKTQMRCDQYHFLQDTLIGKKRNIWKYLDFASCYVQRVLGIRRFRGKKIHYGSAQWSVTGDVVEFILAKKDKIKKQYRWSYCADECFLITELQSTDFIQRLSPLGSLTYAEWVQVSKRDNSPKALSLQDQASISSPDILFARKFVLPTSEELETRILESWKD